jgi:hypothetical protein
MVDAQVRRYRQFRLGPLLVVITAVCAWAAAVHYFGLVGGTVLIVLLAVLLAVATIWACAYVHVPALTKVVTLFGVLGGTLLLALACYLFDAREDARRNQCINNMREHYEEASQLEMLHPGDN